MLRTVLSLLLTMFFASAALAEGPTMIVLDASGSMWGQIGGRTKVEIAREVLADVLRTVPQDTELGLEVYGHRTRGDCSDIEVVVPAAPSTAQAIIDFAIRTKFQGKTPLTEAVRQAALSLRASEQRATVILITDGIETCQSDPCALAAELESSSVDFTAHVVGFGLSDEEGRAVACLAEETGGKYLPATDAAQLGAALSEVVVAQPPAPQPAPPPPPPPAPVALAENLVATVLLAEGAPNYEGRPNDVFWQLFPVANGQPMSGQTLDSYEAEWKVQAPPGDYLLRVSVGEVHQEQPVTLKSDAAATLHFVLNAGVLKLSGLREPGGAVDQDIYIEASSGEAKVYGYGSLSAVMPAGDISLMGKQGSAEATATISLEPGATVETAIVVGSGIASISALYAQGGPAVEGDGIFFEVQSAAARIDGSRETFGYRYGAGQIDLPAGEYVILASLDAARIVSQPFTVSPGQTSEIQIVLEAGVAAISAPGGDGINVIAEAKDTNGNRHEMGYGIGESFQTTLPAGRYIAVVHYPGDRPVAEIAFEVKAGERSEVTTP